VYCFLLLAIAYVNGDGVRYVLSDADKAGLVKAHNKVRALYPLSATTKLCDLTWDESLATSAAENAIKCVMKHTSPLSNGENLYAGGGFPDWAMPYYTWDQVVSEWKSEELNWDCSTNACVPGKACGHLTQVIWQTTTKVGCAVVNCPDPSIWTGYTSQYVVCQYQKPGNLVGLDGKGKHPLVPGEDLAPATTTSFGNCPVAPYTPTASIVSALHEEETQTATNAVSMDSNEIRLPAGVVIGVAVVVGLIVALVVVVIIAFIVVIRKGKDSEGNNYFSF